MIKDIFLIINASITFLAAIISIFSWSKLNKDRNDMEGRRRRILIGSLSSLVVLLMFTLLYFQYGKDILSPPVTPVEREIVDISGYFTGYFTDNLGHQIPTFLFVKYDTKVDSVKMTFKNTHSVTCNAIYLIDKFELEIENLGRGVVKSENGYVIIEAIDNEINDKWKFKKDLVQFY